MTSPATSSASSSAADSPAADSPAADSPVSGPLISAAELAALAGPSSEGASRVAILDATVILPSAQHDGDHRSGSGFDGWLAAHIPGSRHADLVNQLSVPGAATHFAHPDASSLARALEGLGVSDGTDVVVYDTGGGIWAARLWYLLDWIGVPARVLDGGLAAWRAAGLPVTDGQAPAVTPGSLTVRVKPGRWIEKDDLQAWLAGGAGGATVICALGADAYRGDVPSRYARRGRIPGSGNLPARALTGDDGRYLPAPELRTVLGNLIADPAPVWLYCGGGISAAGLALALAVAGREDVALYDGSLEEWAADPSLPLVTGDPVVLSEDVRALIAKPEFAVLSTAEPDGSAQLSVMWLGLDGDRPDDPSQLRGERIVMATKGGRRKVANIRRDPRVTVLVYDRARPTRYVEIRGVAVVTSDDAIALVNELADRYTGRPHEVGTDAEEADRVVLSITPTRVRLFS